MASNWRKKLKEKVLSSSDYTGYRATTNANTSSTSTKSSSNSTDWRQKMKNSISDGSAAKKYQERYGNTTSNSKSNGSKTTGNTKTTSTSDDALWANNPAYAYLKATGAKTGGITKGSDANVSGMSTSEKKGIAANNPGYAYLKKYGGNTVTNGHDANSYGTGVSGTDSWLKKVAAYLDSHTSEADTAFGTAQGGKSLLETINKLEQDNANKKAENTAAADALKRKQKAEGGGTSFGKNQTEKTDDMTWWEKLNADAANAADLAFGTYSPGNATGRSRIGNTVASGLQEVRSAWETLLGYLTDQSNTEQTEADRAFGTFGKSNLTHTDDNGNIVMNDDYYTVPENIKNFWQGISDDAYKRAEDYSTLAQESETMAKDGLGTIGSAAVDLGKVSTQMATDAAFGKLAGVSSLMPMAVRSFGGGVAEAQAEGASDQQAFGYGSMAAATEVLTELIGSVSTPFKAVYGKGAIDDVIEQMISASVKTPLGQAGLRTLFSVLSEGGEEVISDLVNPILKQAMYDKDALAEYGTEEYWSNLLYDGVIGGLMGGLGAGGNVVTAIGQSKAAAKAYGSSPQELVGSGLETPEGTTAHALAQKMQAKLDNGETVSGSESFKLAKAIEQTYTEESAQEAAAEAATEASEQTETANNTPFIPYSNTAKANIAQNIASQSRPTFSDAINALGTGKALTETAEKHGVSAELVERIYNLNPEADTTAFSAAFDAAVQMGQENANEKALDSVPVLSGQQAKIAYAIGQSKAEQSETEQFEAEQEEEANAYDVAYNYGAASVPYDSIKDNDSIANLSETDRLKAYNEGAAASVSSAEAKTLQPTKKQGVKTKRRKGVVKGDGVNIDDLKKRFNDQQKTAYRTLSTIAEVTGIDIILYNSATDESGNYVGEQGRYSKKNNPNAIYIDINAGLDNIKDVNDLGKYAMLRTFSHEFTHFVEQWNAKGYNTLRKIVFDEISKHGENVDDLIAAKMDETGLDYQAASREVVAEAMTDILPDSSFVQTLAERDKTLFEKLRDKLKEFVADLREYFSTIGKNRDAGANALKQQVGDTIKYLGSIVETFDNVAVSAVDTYQDVFSTVEEETTTSENGFTVAENTEYGSVEITFDEKPSEAIRDVLKKNKFRWHGKKKVWYGKTSRETITDELNKAYEAENTSEETPEETPKETPKKSSSGPKEIDTEKFFGAVKAAAEYSNKTGKDVEVPLAAFEKAEETRSEEVPEEATAAEVIEAVSEDAVSEEIPEKAETEEAKKELKKAIKFPAQTANINALIFALNSKELSIENVTLPGEVDGFNLEQRAFLTKQLIEGAYTNVVKIKVDVPFDGKFEIPNKTEAIANVLNKLNVKVTQEVEFNKALVSIIKKSNSVNVCKTNGQWYLITDKATFAVSQAASEYAITEFKAEVKDGKAWSKVVDASGVKIDGVYDAKEGYAFRAGSEYYVAQENICKYFKNCTFDHVSLNFMSGKSLNYIRAKDADGSLQGIIYAKLVSEDKLTIYKEISNTPKTRKGKTNVKENADNKAGVREAESDGDGASRLLDELQAGDVQEAGGQRRAAASDTERGRQAERNSDRESADAGDSGGEGTGESGDLRRDDVLSPEEKQRKAEELEETVEEQIEQQSTAEVKGNNFVIGDSLNLPSGEKARFRANVDAIKLVKQLNDEGRTATAAEQELLSKYVGWGGLSNAFGEMKWNRETHKNEMVSKPNWEKEFAELRQLVDDGVITQEEYENMSASTKNAHYTSVEVIKAMYDGLKQIGFTGGRMLEPSSGVGNFVGAMPADMSSTVKSWTMVELDRITGQIAKYLYPHADVRIQGFETANIPDNYMDVAVGNVPFGNYGVVDRTYPKRITKAIHNYFFAKTLDKVRPGGVVMFITSSFTMNGKDTAIRQYIMDRADLLGAIRLPDTAFKGNAGTDVVTDILILKKRVPGTEYAGEAFLNAPERRIDENTWKYDSVNEYFDNHPEMVLGTATLARGMYGASSLTYKALEGKGTLGEQIREAFKNISGRMDYKTPVTPEKANFKAARAERNKKGGLKIKDGKVCRETADGGVETVSEDKTTVERVTGLLTIRDNYRTLINYLQQGQDKKLVSKARKDLNKAYDEFVKKFGAINSPKNKAAISEDPDQYSLLSLENYDAKKKTAAKADIFTKDTITANKTVSHVDDVKTGVIVSINRTGGIDTSFIAQITDSTKEAVTRELIDSRLAFKTKDGTLEAPETYLSGNVRAKLREAEALAPLDKDYQNNVEELKKVIPKDIPFNDIYVAVGSPWIPNNVYADFIAEMLGGYNNETSYRGPDVTVGRTSGGDFKIVINNAALKSRFQNTQKWGTRRKSFLDIMNALMSSTSVKVNDYIEDENGKRKAVLNKVETAAAQEKAEEISKEFQDWLWRDEGRRKELASLYNETFNALVTPKYSGENLSVNGLNAAFNLRSHQANAVQRIISSGGNTLLAHRVGAGKTLEMAAAAMKLRELGIVKKPMFVVPKALVAQWGVEFKNYFPAAKLLVSDEKSFTKANRKTYSNRIANGDYDAVILSYEQFEKIPMSKEYLHDFYQQQIDEVIAAIAEEKAESRDGKGLTVKEMEKKKAQLQKKQAELTTKSKDEDNIDFDMLGVDSLFVDEAHSFKNLQYVTRMNNVSGLSNSDGSQRAFDLYAKVRYLQGLNGGRGIVFATATPVMNSMAEMYIMQKYLQSDMLEQLGLKSFDAWAKQFGEVVNSVEIKPSGQGFRVKQTFSNFRNLNELQLLFRSFSDVITQIPGLKIPKMKGGKVTTVVCEPGQFQKDYMAELEKRADNVKNVDPSVDNMLKITSDGRKVSYSQRMIDPTLPYEQSGKVYRCCDNVLAEYKASRKVKGTQLVFCDMATPKGKSKKSGLEETDDAFDAEEAHIYDDMKAYLIKKGIPANEIAFIHDANTDEKKKQLFADVNDGKIRVLIGSTGKMGVGMNAQKRVVAIHHLDAPWRPGDVEQRDGRAFRQGNINDEVAKYVYVTEGTFDARLWDILDRKQHFIEQIMNGEDVGRSAEDTGDVTLSAAEVKALASGNPMIMEQVQLSNDLTKLQDLKRAHNSSVTAAKAKLLEDEQKITMLKTSIAKAKTDVKARVDTYSDGKFSMTVGGKKFTEKKEAGVALAAEIVSKAKEGEFITVGKFAGFELKVIKQKSEYIGTVAGAQNYRFNVYPDNTTYMVNHISGVIQGIDHKIEVWTELLAETKTDLAAQEEIIASPFAKQAELDQKTARFNEVMAILNPKEEQLIGEDDDTQYQARRKRTRYSETETLFMQWENGSAPVGEIKRFFRFKKAHYYEKTAEGCVEITRAEYDERNNFDAKDIDRKSKRGIRQTVNSNGIAGRNAVGYSNSNRNTEGTEILSRHTVGEQLRNDAGGSISSNGRNDNGVSDSVDDTQDKLDYYRETYDDAQFQQRTSPLTNREVLSIAADGLNLKDLTDGEKTALDIFKKRLDTLRELEDKRIAEGRTYKEQQFGSNVDRKAAKKTLERMKILDEQIKRASNSVLDVEKKEVLKRVLESSRKVIETQERAHGKELLDRYRDRQKNAAAIKKYRAKIKADTDVLSKWILHPDNKNALNRVPDALKDSIIPFVTSIDFTSKRALRGGAATKADAEFLKRLEKLKSALKKNADIQGMYSGYNDLPEGFMDRMQSFIDTTRKLTENRNGDFVINQMTAEELQELSKLVRVVKKLITQMNSFHQNAMFQHTYEAGQNSVDYMGKIKGNARNTGMVSEFLLWTQIRPAYAFERFGEGGISIYNEFRNAQSTLAFNTKKIEEFAKNAYTGAQVKEWESKTETFKFGDDVVKIPVSYLMGFYELSKQSDALEHLYGEGIRVATYKNGKEKISDVGHALTLADVQEMKKRLREKYPEAVEVADKLQKYMATQGAEWGNYVSVARFGEEQFTNPLYYPLNSDGRHLDANADEHPNAASLYALLNMSFTKSRKEGANNRLVLYSIFDVFSNHMASMAQYNAFALPILDSLKWFNYQEIEIDEEGGKHRLDSVREEMARVYGVPEESRPGSGRKGYAENFVMGIIKAFNGTETQGIPTDTTGINAMHRYNLAQIAYNFRVVVQQPMAITRAGMLVDYKNIIKGLRLSPAAIKANIDEMHKYSGIAVWKSLGFYDVNISKGLSDIIKHNHSIIDKIGDVGMWGAEKADLLTWSAIWSACKVQVQKERGKATDEEFYKQVTKLFENVIYKTQVVDSVLTKNEFMRSKGAWARLVGSFMSEPTTTASMLIDAYGKYSMDIQRGMSRQNAWKLNKKNIGRTAYVYAVSAVLLAAVQAVMDGWRDDDDYKTFFEKWLDAFKGNVIDEAMPINKLPILSDFYELIKSLLETFGVDTYGNEPSSVLFQWRDYLVKSSEILNDKIKGEDTNYTWYAGIYKMLQAVSGITGLPLATVTREITSAWNSTAGAMAPSLKVKTYDSGEKSNIKYAFEDGYLTEDEAIEALQNMSEDALSADEAWIEVNKWKNSNDSGTTFDYVSVYDAIDNGGDIRGAVKDMQEHGKEDGDIRSALTRRYKEAYIAGDATERAKIRKALYATGLYDSANDVVKKCNGWLKEDDED